MKARSSIKRAVVALVSVGAPFACDLWPQPASAIHIRGITINVVSVDSIAGSVDVDVIESSGSPFGSHFAPDILWGDVMSSNPPWTSNFTETASPGINFHKVSAAHVYPDLTTRTITVISDCCFNYTQPATDTVQVDFGCSDTPLIGCRTAMKAQLQIKNNADDAKDQLKFKWLKGQETLIEALGEPTTSTEYYVCIYDPGLAFQAIVPPGTMSWSAAGTKGFKYKNKNGDAGGVTKIKLKSGVDDKAKLSVKGKGANLDNPLPLPLPLTQPVLVQVQNSLGECWEHQFTSPEAENSADVFKDKEP